jgi:hypothetical protein
MARALPVVNSWRLRLQTWRNHFDGLLKAMGEGEWHKAEKRREKAIQKPVTRQRPISD